MEANELRIGNKLKMPFLGDCELTVFGLAVKDDMSLYIQSKSNSSSMFFEKPDKYEPIPITEEWLLKFGFKEGYKCEAYHNFVMLQPYFTVVIRKNVIRFHIEGDFNVDIEYIHQLQNLYFALTQTELQLVDTQN